MDALGIITILIGILIALITTFFLRRRSRKRVEEPQYETVSPPSFQHDPPKPQVDEAIQLDNVLFRAYFPHEVQVGRVYGFYIYAFKEEFEGLVNLDVQRFKQELGGVVPYPKQTKQYTQLQRGIPINVEVEWEVSGLQSFGTSQATWNGDRCLFDQHFSIDDENLVGETVVAHVSIRIGAIEIARIRNCALNVIPKVETEHFTNPNQQEPNPLAEAKSRHQTTALYQCIFVSYSREDIRLVKNYMLAQFALGNEVFVDTYSIRSGEDWQAALANAIDRADIFQLFWSKFSARSRHVRDEWQYALQYKCPQDLCREFIRPFYWEAELPEPPEELKHLNFRYVDWLPD